MKRVMKIESAPSGTGTPTQDGSRLNRAATFVAVVRDATVTVSTAVIAAAGLIQAFRR